MKTDHNLLVLLVFPVMFCSAQHPEKKDAKVFEDKETGWSVNYPASWNVVDEAEIARIEGRGQAALESVVDEKIEMNHKNLLWLKKDPFNSMSSTSQPFDSVADGSYAENQKILYEAIGEAYTSQGLQFDVKLGSVKIDGLNFSTMETTLYTPDRKNVILYQRMYDRLINGSVSLTLNINYNNEIDKQVLLDLINSSKLVKRD